MKTSDSKPKVPIANEEHQRRQEFDKKLLVELEKVKRFAYSLKKTEAEANELTQKVALRALEKWEQFQEGTEFDLWLITICRNLFFDELRSQKLKPTISGEAAEIEIGKLSTPGNQESSIYLSEVLARYENLNQDQKTVFLKVVIDGKSYIEVAEELKLPIGTVMSRLARARRILQEKK